MHGLAEPAEGLAQQFCISVFGDAKALVMAEFVNRGWHLLSGVPVTSTP